MKLDKARAEFCLIFRSFFGQWRFKKNWFWDLPTFRQQTSWLWLQCISIESSREESTLCLVLFAFWDSFFYLAKEDRGGEIIEQIHNNNNYNNFFGSFFFSCTVGDLSLKFVFVFPDIYLAHVIEKPNLRIPNPQYLQLFF